MLRRSIFPPNISLSEILRKNVALIKREGATLLVSVAAKDYPIVEGSLEEVCQGVDRLGIQRSQVESVVIYRSMI